MFEPNPFGKEETVNIIETRPRTTRIAANVRAIRILPDPNDWKAKPLLDDIDALIGRLPNETVELIDIHYNCADVRVHFCFRKMAGQSFGCSRCGFCIGADEWNKKSLS